MPVGNDPLASASTPDVTSVQIIAVVTGAVGLAVSFGLLDGHRAQDIVAAASTIVPAVLILADSIIRHGRAQVAAAATLSSGVQPGPSAFIEPNEVQNAPKK